MKQNKNKGKGTALIRRAIATLLSASMLTTSIISYEMVDEIGKLNTLIAYADQNQWTFTCIEDFVNYSKIYANGGHQRDTLIFALNPAMAPSGIDVKGENESDEEYNTRLQNYKDANTISSFIPLGQDAQDDRVEHPEYAFCGKIEYNGQAERSAIELLNQPIFAYLSDSADITVNTGTNYVKMCRQSSGTEPILARHIIHDTAYEEAENPVRSWVLEIGLNNEGGTPNFGGLIGEMASNSRLNITLYNNATSGQVNADVAGSGNAGLYCGTLGENAELTVTMGAGSTNVNYSVSSGDEGIDSVTGEDIDYHAGAIVGEMLPGSTLTVSGGSISGDRNVTASGYAGGLVGKAVSAEFVYDSSYTISESISGGLGAGGIAGYYCCSGDNTFNLTNATINCKLTSANAGGLFGVLETQMSPSEEEGEDPTPMVFTIAGTAEAPLSFTSTAAQTDTAAFYGGLIGTYKTDSLKNKLAVSNTTTVTKGGGINANYAGFVGRVDDTAAPAYMEFSDIKNNNSISSHEQYGGVIANAGNNGSFLNVGNFTLTGTLKGSAIAGTIGTGIIRLEGVTDISSATVTWAQLVNKRGNALIYALGSGEDSGWKYQRSTTNSNYDHDDIGNWGQVLRMSSGNETITGAGEGNRTAAADKLYVTFDKAAHTTTVAASTTDWDSTEDFVRTALNVQLNQGNLGALQFTDTGKGTELLDDTFTVSGTIDLRGTGITGLMRDDGKQNTDHAAAMTEAVPFSGKISKKSGASTAEIRLAIGEYYGVKDKKVNNVTTSTNLSTLADQRSQSSNNFYTAGEIHNHTHNGLLAVTNGAEISDIKLTGSINYTSNFSNSNSIFIGGFSALDTGSLKLTGIDAEEKLYCYTTNGDNYRYVFIGGLIGAVQAANESEISVSGTNSTGIEITKRDWTYASNSIGFVGDKANVNQTTTRNNAISIDFNDYTLSGNGTDTGYLKSSSLDTYPAVNNNGENNTTKRGDNACVGGLIAVVNSSSNNDRTIELHNVTLRNYTLDVSARRSAGGLLGYAWYNSTVTIAPESSAAGKFGLLVDNCSDTVSLHTGYYSENFSAGGLLCDATGHFSVADLKVKNTTFSGPDLTSFGVLVNKGVHAEISNYKNIDSVLFMEFTASGTPDLSTGNSLSDMTKLNVFDELCAFSGFYNNAEYTIPSGMSPANAGIEYKPSTSKVTNNGNGVISIHTANGTVANTDGSCAVYQNQITSLPSQITSADGGMMGNRYTRYYYDLDRIIAAANATTPYTGMTAPKMGAYQLMLWSLEKYAHTSIQTYFPSVDIPSTADLSDVSYYPIDLSSSLALTDFSLTFNNDAIETAETATGNTDGYKRSTLIERSQHHLMHTGLFRNVNMNGSLMIAGDLTLSGSIGCHEGGSGALITGMLGNTAIGNSTTFSANYGELAENEEQKFITLSGLYVAGTNDYRPLLINKIGSRTSFNLQGVKTAANSYDDSKTAASSLIGKVGATDENGNLVSENIVLDFKDIRLDGRTAGYTPANANATTALNTAYGTTRTIFSRATLLDEFYYASSTNSGTYNYEWAEDWSSTDDALHHVTYGKEITGSIDYDGQQEHYLGDTRYTSPESGAAASEYDKFGNFLQYVYNIGSKDDNYRELSVNHTASEIEQGCGTYNDPYIITTGAQLVYVAKAMQQKPVEGFKFNYPVTKTKTDKWCAGKEAHFQITYSGSSYTASAGNTAPSIADAADWLAGAYYQIQGDETTHTITISDSSFPGLGANTDNDTTSKQTAFRGIIVGNKTTPPTIINETQTPLIKTSNGSVIKDVNIQVAYNGTFDTLSTKSIGTNAKFNYRNGLNNYGAVIGQIMGGDNIIDNVSVVFDAKTKVAVSGSGAQLIPVGGYVGVVVNGALIFKNMGFTEAEKAAGRSNAGLQATNVDTTFTYTDAEEQETEVNALSEDCDAYLYINPIVGRVLNAYAFTESTSYKWSEDGSRGGSAVTMRNGRKNYSIPDLVKPTSDNQKLDIGRLSSAQNASGATTGDYGKTTITFPDEQSVFILSSMIQSCMTTAWYKSYKFYYIPQYGMVGYGNNEYKTTHIADYDHVGEADSSGDFTLSKNDTFVAVASNSNTLSPYVVENYITHNETSAAKCGIFNISGFSTLCNIVLSGDDGRVWKLPDGFRGLGCLMFGITTTGSIYSDLTLDVYGLDGKDDTFDLNMTLKYYKSGFENYPPGSQAGFGLFNNVIQNVYRSRYDNNGDYTDPDDGNKYYAIKDLNITGSVFADVIDKTTGETIVKNATKDELNNSYNVSVGGFAGTTNWSRNESLQKYIIQDIDLKNLNIHGVRNAGGLFGHAEMKTDTNGFCKMIIEDCDAQGLTVSSAFYTGGMLGYVKDCVLTIDGDTSNAGQGVYQINSVNSTSTLINGEFDAGGLIGNVTGKPVIIQNMDIGKLDASYSGFIGRSDRSKDGLTEAGVSSLNYKPQMYVGGLIGYLNNTATITNANVYNINMYGGRTGGLIGTNTNDCYYHITNCKVKSTSKNYLISGWYQVGGLVGLCNGDNCNGTDDAKKYYIDSCSIENYTIRGYNLFSNGIQRGGFIGQINNGHCIVVLTNSAISDCDIQTQGGDSNANNNGSGGLIGYCNGTLLGYNILIDDIRLMADDRNDAILDYRKIDPNGGTKAAYGYIYGGYTNDWTCVRISGLSVQKSADNEYMDQPWAGVNNSTKNEYGIDHSFKYVIYADTLGQSLTNPSYTFSGFNDDDNVSYTEDSTRPAAGSLKTVDNITKTTENGVTSTSHTRSYTLGEKVSPEINNQKETTGNTTKITSQKNYYDQFPFNYPYVTSSPYTMLGETAFLTGDGAYIKEITADEDGNLVLTVPADSVTAAAGTTLAGDITKYTQGKSMLSTYETEMGSLPAGCQDFPVIVTDGNNLTALGNFIDNYIRVLTQSGDAMNTLGLNFKSDSTSDNKVFKIELNKCVYDAELGSFKIDGDAEGLTLDNKGYHVNIAKPDNANTTGQFTLVDVQFFNPNKTTEVAYHLYIPVLVKRLIKFNCVTSSLPSAYYGEAQFVPRNPSVCALGTPVTFYARYTYQNTIQDWQNALNIGDSLMWHYNKKITLTMGADIDLLPDETRMILVDKNLDDKAFYATGKFNASDGIFTKSTESNGDSTLTVDLSKFKAQEDDTTLHGNAMLDFGERIKVNAIRYEAATEDQKAAAQVTYITSDKTKAYAKANFDGESSYFTLYNESDYADTPEDEKPQRYVLIVDEGSDATAVLPLTETYYLTFFTDDKDDELRILTAQSVQSLPESTAISHPSRRDDTNNRSNPTSLILGDLFQQDFQYFVTDAGVVDGDAGLINQQKKYVDAMVSATISLKDNAEVTKAIPYISGDAVKLYHCFLLKMTKNTGLTTETSITGNPTFSQTEAETVLGTYQVKYAGKNIQYTGISSTNSAANTSAIFSTSPPAGKNYILLTETTQSGELMNIKNLVLDRYGNRYTATISRNIRITYDSKSDRDDQYPSRSQKGLPENIDVAQIGTMFTAFSNLDTDQTNIAQSHITKKADDETTTKYHTNDDTTVEMTYNAVKDTRQYFNALGVNPLDDADDFTQTIVAEGHYDATTFLPALSAEKIRFVLSMDQKQKISGTNVFEYQNVKMSDYVVGNVTDGEGHVFKANNDGSYELLLDYSDGMAATDITTIFTVKTDAELRNVSGGLYTNYMVTLYVYLYEGDGTLIQRSDKYDYIVYTNAKVNPSFIKRQ